MDDGGDGSAHSWVYESRWGSGLMSCIHPECQARLPCNEKRQHSEYILPAKSFEPQCEMADTRPEYYDYGQATGT